MTGQGGDCLQNAEVLLALCHPVDQKLVDWGEFEPLKNLHVCAFIILYLPFPFRSSDIRKQEKLPWSQSMFNAKRKWWCFFTDIGQIQALGPGMKLTACGNARSWLLGWEPQSLRAESGLISVDTHGISDGVAAYGLLTTVSPRGAYVVGVPYLEGRCTCQENICTGS